MVWFFLVNSVRQATNGVADWAAQTCFIIFHFFKAWKAAVYCSFLLSMHSARCFELSYCNSKAKCLDSFVVVVVVIFFVIYLFLVVTEGDRGRRENSKQTEAFSKDFIFFLKEGYLYCGEALLFAMFC